MKKLLILFFIAGVAKQSLSQNLNLTLAGQLSYGSESLSNICGWLDTADGKEYALVGAQNGLSIVDVSTPSAPVQIIQIPGPPSTWREIKTWGDYAYVTTEDGAIGLQIVELTNLPSTTLAVTTWKPLIGIDSLETIHALHIDNGKVYLYGSNVGNGGAIIADIVTNPMAPVYLGSYDLKYIHDGYVRNDTMYAGHINDGECAIVNASNPASPTLLASFQTPNVFTHNTWLSADSKTCFTTDEVANSYLASFNISNFGNIFEEDRVQASPGSGAIVHNTHIIQNNNIDYAVTSWYTEGLTIVDAGRPNNLVQVGNYDTYSGPSGGFNGCWGVYPFFPSGTIVASDIQTGLYVFTPTYVRACYLEGVVTDCISGNPLSGVTAQIQITAPTSNSHIDVTDAQGNYAVGTVAPGSYQVIYSKPAYVNDTVTVALSTGNVTIQNVQLCLSPQFTLTGQIYDNATSLGISNANVRIQDAATIWDTITDSNGNFSIPAMYTGTFEIVAGKWGYTTECLGNQNINPSTAPISMGLDKGIYDDFTWDWGWTVSGNASTGIWERGEPLGTEFSAGYPFNPGYDIITDCSEEAYVTGNQGVAFGDDILWGEATVLTSPTFDLTGYTTPRLYLARWVVLLLGATDPPNDTFKIMLSNGITTATLFQTSGLNWQGQWTISSYQVSNYLTPTSTMNLIVRVADSSVTDNVVIEAGLDYFYIKEMSGSSVEDISNKVNVSIYPNPFSASATLLIMNVETTNPPAGRAGYEFKLYDLYGREVKNETIQNSERFIISKDNLPGGMYFYKVTAGEKIIGTGKCVIE